VSELGAGKGGNGGRATTVMVDAKGRDGREITMEKRRVTL